MASRLPSCVLGTERACDDQDLVARLVAVALDLDVPETRPSASTSRTSSTSGRIEEPHDELGAADEVDAHVELAGKKQIDRSENEDRAADRERHREVAVAHEVDVQLVDALHAV